MKKQHLKLSLLGAMLLAMNATVNAQWTENATAVYLTNGTKLVGIGTNSPSYPLDIKQAGNCNFRIQSITSGSSNLILARSAAAGTNCLVNYKTGTAQLWNTGCSGNDDFSIIDALSKKRFVISQATGNVGIGTATPQHNLTVGANTADGQTVTVRGYSNSPLSWKGGAAFGYNQASVIMGELGGIATIGGHDATLSSWTNLSINPGGGFVGIGTTSPITPLDVNGTGKFGSYLKIGTDVDEGYFQNAQDGAYRALQTGGDQGYWFQNYNGINTTMYVGLNGLYQGKVGIGNTAPSANLDVTGNVKITDGTQGAGKVLTSDSLGFASWQPAATSGWSLSGNSGINSNNFMGTKNNSSLRIRTNNIQRMIVDSTGKVGIGATTPLANLHITNPGSTSSFLLGETNLSGGYTSLTISTSANTGGYCNLQSIKSAGSAWGDIVLNRDGGSVTIGTTKVATGYKLSVNGSIMCTALRVQDFASWPDYVFANDYDLKSLSEVEDYITTNKRLPGMPSDCEVMENGIDVGQMQAKVVEKVEENTLYIIQLSKENQELKAQLKAIQAQLNAMQK